MTLMPPPLQVVYPVAKEGDYNVNITWNGKCYCYLSRDLLICTVEMVTVCQLSWVTTAHTVCRICFVVVHVEVLNAFNSPFGHLGRKNRAKC